VTVKFEHPYSSPTTDVTLRNPNLGDARQLSVYIRLKKSMSGVVVTYKSTPTTQKLLLTFRHLTKVKIDSLRTFISTSMGSEIKYTDHTSIVWRGYILSDPIEFVTQGRKGGSCIEISTVTFEFQGTKV